MARKCECDCGQSNAGPAGASISPNPGAQKMAEWFLFGDGSECLLSFSDQGPKWEFGSERWAGVYDVLDLRPFLSLARWGRQEQGWLYVTRTFDSLDRKCFSR